MKKLSIMNKIKNKKYTVVRVEKDEFELEDGTIHPIPFELDEVPSIEEFQKMLDNSKNIVLKLLESADGKTSNN